MILALAGVALKPGRVWGRHARAAIARKGARPGPAAPVPDAMRL